ncbi:MAG: ABC transporter substrate-binding protein, partial [Haloplanus sp.]
MSERSRRDVLRGLGATGTVGIVSLAGCSQQDGGGGDEATATETSMEGDMEDSESTATETEGDMEGGGEPISLGSLFPITGTNSAYGGGHQRAFNLAVEEINGSGGVLGGRQINPINRDTEGSPSRAAQKFRTMINQEGI